MREREAGVDQTGIAGSVEVRGLDRDAMTFLEPSEPLDQAVERGCLEPQAKPRLTVRALVAERGPETGFARGAIDQHDE